MVRSLLIALFAILFVVALLVFEMSGGVSILKQYSAHSNENLDFSFSYCSSESSHEEKVISSEWASNGNLIVKAIATPNCATTWLFGGYEANGDNVVLTYTPVMGGAMACLCNFDVKYEISNLEKATYNISIKEAPGISFDSIVINKLYH